MVIAETITQAKDAAESIFVDIDPLTAVTTASAAAAFDAPQLHADAPGNVCLNYPYGDSERIAAAFASAAHVTKMSLRNDRIVACPMEPRSAIGEYDAESDRLILRLVSQES
jgi:carbon-monoxide dehydrogenase large subunit